MIGIVMGSKSDLPIMEKSAEILDRFAIKYTMDIISAHRNPRALFEYAETAESRGIKVIIAAAGGAAHLPGITAGLTTIPVIGVPISSQLSGVDSLLSIVQMPKGVPVATVSIGIPGAINAAVLAAQILGLHDDIIKKKLIEYKEELKK